MFSKTSKKIDPNPNQKSWLALALDMDECFLNIAYRAQRQLLIKTQGPLTLEQEEELFISCNLKALDTIVQVAEDYYKRVFLLLGSKRQDKQTDELNNRLKGTISSPLAMNFITKYLCTHLSTTPVALLQFAMADCSIGEDAALGNIGLTFDDMLQQGDEPGPEWGGIDASKQTIAYAHSHYLGWIRAEAKEENTEVVYALVDDGINILIEGAKAIAENPAHYPAKLKFRHVFYNGENCEELASKLLPNIPSLAGCGEVDANFMGTLRALEETHANQQSWPEQDFHYLNLSFDNTAQFHQAIRMARLEAAALLKSNQNGPH